MAGQVAASPTFALTPSSERTPTAQNYIVNFDFLNQYLPDTYEKEFERYGNRTISSFLRMVGAEMPTNSDLIKWAEQGRLHTKYTSVGTAALVNADQAVFQVNDVLDPTTAEQVIRVGQTIVVVQNDGSGMNKAVVSAVDNTAGGRGQFTADFYEAGGLVTAGTGLGNADCTVFIYGSEFKKGTAGMVGSLEANDLIFDNKPIIIKDTYNVSGSDMAQIGWVEVTTEDGATGYLWYLKSEHETRLRFDDYLETAMIEAVPAEQNSGAAAILGSSGAAANPGAGSDGIFYAVEQRGNIWSGGNPTTLADFDSIISRLDKQGAIEENVLFVDRQFAFDIDDMLAAQNSYGAGGTSYGLFDNDEEMALNLGFSGFRRGSYDFYKSDFRYLNDLATRGGINAANAAEAVRGVIIPAGTSTVYDQQLGKNLKRPFLHVRYRASQTDDRRMKTWTTGSVGASTSALDAMQIHFLSERCLIVQGANNFMIMK